MKTGMVQGTWATVVLSSPADLLHFSHLVWIAAQGAGCRVSGGARLCSCQGGIQAHLLCVSTSGCKRKGRPPANNLLWPYHPSTA